MTTTTQQSTCPPWCKWQEDADNSGCEGVHRQVLARSYPEPGYFTAYPYGYPDGQPALVWFGLGFKSGYKMTADEARKVAEALIQAADEIDPPNLAREQATAAFDAYTAALAAGDHTQVTEARAALTTLLQS